MHRDLDLRPRRDSGDEGSSSISPSVVAAAFLSLRRACGRCSIAQCSVYSPLSKNLWVLLECKLLMNSDVCGNSPTLHGCVIRSRHTFWHAADQASSCQNACWLAQHTTVKSYRKQAQQLKWSPLLGAGVCKQEWPWTTKSRTPQGQRQRITRRGTLSHCPPYP